MNVFFSNSSALAHFVSPEAHSVKELCSFSEQRQSEFQVLGQGQIVFGEFFLRSDGKNENRV